MSKKNSHNMNILLSKIGQIKTIKNKLNFTNMTSDMSKLVGNSIETIYELLVDLHKRFEDHSFLHTAILRLSH